MNCTWFSEASIFLLYFLEGYNTFSYITIKYMNPAKMKADCSGKLETLLLKMNFFLCFLSISYCRHSKHFGILSREQRIVLMKTKGKFDIE